MAGYMKREVSWKRNEKGKSISIAWKLTSIITSVHNRIMRTETGSTELNAKTAQTMVETAASLIRQAGTFR